MRASLWRSYVVAHRPALLRRADRVLTVSQSRLSAILSTA